MYQNLYIVDMYKCMFPNCSLNVRLFWAWPWFEQNDWCALKRCVCRLGSVLVNGSRVATMRGLLPPTCLCSGSIPLDFYPNHLQTLVYIQRMQRECVVYTCYFYVQRWCDVDLWTWQWGHVIHDNERAHFIFYRSFCLLQNKSGKHLLYTTCCRS